MPNPHPAVDVAEPNLVFVATYEGMLSIGNHISALLSLPQGRTRQRPGSDCVWIQEFAVFLFAAFASFCWMVTFVSVHTDLPLNDSVLNRRALRSQRSIGLDKTIPSRVCGRLRLDETSESLGASGNDAEENVLNTLRRRLCTGIPTAEQSGQVDELRQDLPELWGIPYRNLSWKTDSIFHTPRPERQPREGLK